MTVLEEGTLQLVLPRGTQGRKFDDDTHGLSHCMKAVDFIIETSDSKRGIDICRNIPSQELLLRVAT